MLRIHSLVTVVGTTLAIGMAMVTAPGFRVQAAEQQELTAMDELVAGNNAFAVNLYRELAANEGNVFFSPYSISTALAMTYAGARENTADEMQTALSFRLQQAELHPTFGRLQQRLQARARETNQRLRIANGLCLTGGHLSDTFKTTLQKHYNAELFTGDLGQINAWVARQTENKIPKILDSLDPNSVCVLLNAIYFKGTWQSQFDERRTHEAPFKLSTGKEVPAEFMYRKGRYRLLEGHGFQAIVLPYKGEALSMVVLLPSEVDGLAKLERELTAAKLTQRLAELASRPARETELYLPKFKLQTEYNLVPACKRLGMHDAFDTTGRADFSGMGWPKGELWISQIKHKAYIEVNEEGTEAAAATATEMATTAVPQRTVFRADHPFLFVIYDNSTGSILFWGRIADPRGD